MKKSNAHLWSAYFGGGGGGTRKYELRVSFKCNHINFVECMKLVDQDHGDEILPPVNNLVSYNKLQVAVGYNKDANSIKKTI